MEIRKYSEKYNQEHKKEMNNTRARYQIQRRKTDIRFRLTLSLRSRLSHAIKNNIKSLPTMVLIGCEIDYLLYHLQSQFQPGMTWDNHGRGWGNKGLKRWHINHKQPCVSFDLSKPEEQQKCFNYKNLQPLWAKDNLAKSDTWNNE